MIDAPLLDGVENATLKDLFPDVTEFIEGAFGASAYLTITRPLPPLPPREFPHDVGGCAGAYVLPAPPPPPPLLLVPLVAVVSV